MASSYLCDRFSYQTLEGPVYFHDEHGAVFYFTILFYIRRAFPFNIPCRYLTIPSSTSSPFRAISHTSKAIVRFLRQGRR
jgi:hypothetical protein